MLSDKMQKMRNDFSDKQKQAIEARYRDLRDDYMTLQEIRKHQNITQEDMANLLGIRQENVSRMERRKDMRISTIKEYVEALGGKIEVTAVFPDNKVIPIVTALK